MANLEYTVTRIDTQTLEALRKMAAANLRSVPMQIRALVLDAQNRQPHQPEVIAAQISAVQNVEVQS